MHTLSYTSTHDVFGRYREVPFVEQCRIRQCRYRAASKRTAPCASASISIARLRIAPSAETQVRLGVGLG